MKYCPECGNKLIDAIVDETKVRKCNNCGYVDWGNLINVAAVVVAFNDKNEFLMVSLKGREKGKLTFPGGYRNIGETIEEAAIREFYEETGMRVTDLELYKFFTKDEQRLLWVVYRGVLPKEIKFVDNNETEEIYLVSKDHRIDESKLRGLLTKQVYLEILK
ncbi:NUDIX domain-containing protein [Haploplasma axanthum]|nr:NUDIX domain-containing protein [Haploplasma axanthum]